MSLRGVASETLAIVEAKRYTSSSGKEVTIDVDRAVEGTKCLTPAELAALPRPSTKVPMKIEVTDESTSAASRRLFSEKERVLALNFASARNEGGGFLGGAKAQEEDLCRCSALFPCIERQQVYYKANRAVKSTLYTDHMIYSPDVPFFRDDRLDLVDEPYLVSIVTAPAPNAGAIGDSDRPKLRETFERRVDMILRLAAANEHRCLVLGAWGCGAFHNDPVMVADVFARALEASPWASRVVFGIYDKTKERSTLAAFRKRFDQR